MIHYDDNNILQIYKNCKEASNTLGISSRSIYDVCCGRQLICKKDGIIYKLRYYNEKTDDLTQMKIIQ